MKESSGFPIALSFVTKSTKYKSFVFKCSSSVCVTPRDNGTKRKVENAQALAKKDFGVSQHSTGWMETVSLAWSLLDSDIRVPLLKLRVGNLEPYFEMLLDLSKCSDYSTTIW